MPNAPYATTSGRVTSDSAVVTQSGLLHSVSLEAATSAIIYDNASAASGTVLWTGSVSQSFNAPIAFQNGIYIDITGTGMTVAYSLS